ncbi:MAG: hypothetical protein JEY99_09235 [Spirochaetales bacterium]|nr:hypothetical protein [Spirochaetales bacterium]
MDNFVLFCKTYAGDFDRARFLVESIDKHNMDNIPLYFSVPAADLDLFRNGIKSDNLILVTDEEISENLYRSNTEKFSKGYLNQQIIKLTFWKLGVCNHYFALDSDSYFIRDFYLNDFLFDEETPYVNLFQWEDHFLDTDFIQWVGIYKNNINTINAHIGLETSKCMTCPGFTTLSVKVLESFENEFLIKKGWDYQKLMDVCPFEFSWYNQWLIKCGLQRIMPVTGFFKVFHYKKLYKESRKKLVKEADIASMFLGIIMQSNWKPFPPPIKYKDPAWYHYSNYYLEKFFTRAYYKIRKILSGKNR